MAKSGLKDTVEKVFAELFSDDVYELYNVEYVKEGRDRYLTLYIDKRTEEGYGYVDTDDCEKVSRAVGERLDELDPIDRNYYLVVSSPGLDRELVKPEHFERYRGSEIEVRLYRQFEGSKAYSGELISAEDGKLILKAKLPAGKGRFEEKLLEIPMEQVAKANLTFTF